MGFFITLAIKISRGNNRPMFCPFCNKETNCCSTSTHLCFHWDLSLPLFSGCHVLLQQILPPPPPPPPTPHDRKRDNDRLFYILVMLEWATEKPCVSHLTDTHTHTHTHTEMWHTLAQSHRGGGGESADTHSYTHTHTLQHEECVGTDK